MKFLGILLIIAGIAVLFSGAILVGLIVIAIGGVCCGVANKNKEQTEQANEMARQKDLSDFQKRRDDDWILERTKKYIDEGMAPADAKVKAEVDFKFNKNN